MSDIELKSLLADRALGTPTGRIVRALSERGALSATQIAGLSGLAKSTVSTTLKSLKDSGLVVENPVPGKGKVGRPATILTLNPDAGTCVGILIGLAHIQVILADVSHAVLADKTYAIEADYSPQEAVSVAKRLVCESYAEQGLSMESLLGVGIAVAGPVNPVNGRMLRASGVPTWVGVDVPEVFLPAFNRPVIADNESNCSAIAEMMWGSAMGHQDFVMFTVDVGVGGAIVVGGRVLRGIAGGAGEFGHMSINPDGPLCRCGNRGCLELYASFEEPLRHAARRFGRVLTIQEVIAMALDGDIGCRRLIEDTAEIAGRGLGIIGTAVNPGLIVVGGRLALAGDLLMKPLKASFEKHTLVKSGDVPPAARTELKVSRFVENDACMGAVGLVLRQHNAVSYS